MYWLSIFRIATLAFAILSAIVLLGVGAHALAPTSTFPEIPTFAWAGLGVATAVFALLTLPAMLVIDFLRTGAFSSMIVVELAWFGFLGVLFLATGSSAAERAADFWVTCNTSAQSLCSENSAAAAFGFLGWLVLWAYSTTLLVLALIHANRGHYVWKTSVKEANFFGAGISPANPMVPTTLNVYGPEAKPYEAASLNPAQMPYAYPPSTTASPAPSGYPHPSFGQPATAAPGQMYPNASPQV
ncbi:hypothetical protein C8Q77DRAFT_1158273 [Trametes polyzona]|nr:hypothetical protein C8Q77DRAFT_1158273 [Trametes polyzona]